MTTFDVSLVDVLVLGGTGDALRVLILRRGPHGRSPGSWEIVHGHVDPGETPVDAALRELKEETGLVPDRFYNLSRAEMFYLPKKQAMAIVPAFVAFVPAEAAVALSEEHDDLAWCWPDEARVRFAWPREARALDDALRLLAKGDAGPLEDALRIC